MYNIKSDKVSYLVPMDHIDLGYLKRTIQIGDTVKPLWTPHQKEYSHFQLKAWRKDTDGDNFENNVTTMCHICNIAVPVLYLKVHNNSKKHKSFLRIVNEALERVKNNMNVDEVSRPKTDLSPSTHFCEVCTVIIPKNDKGTHENSITHQNMQKQDEIIENFATLFEKANDVYSNDSNNNFVPKLNDVNSNDNAQPKNGEIKKATQLELLQEYINSLKSKYMYASFKIEVADENFISVKVQGCTLKVNIDDFNSFTSSYEACTSDELVCLLCKVVFKSKDSHMWTEMHMKNVMTPLSDQNCIRQVNQAHGHCIICNELIKDVGHHLDINHKIKLKRAHMIYDTTCELARTLFRQIEKAVPKLPEINKNVTKNSESNETNEENAQTLVRKAKENVPKPELNNVTYSPNPNGSNKENATIVKQTEGAASKLPELNKNVNNTPKTNGNNKEIKSDEPNDANTTLHHLLCFTPNPKELLCRVCLCVIPALLYNVNDHLQGRNHKKKFDEFLSINKLRKVKNGFACDDCRLYVPEKTEIQHVSSRAHKVNIETGIKFNVTYCEPCYIYLDSNNIECHLNGKKHKQNVKSANENNIAKDGGSVEGNKKYADVAATPKTVHNVQGNTGTRVHPPTTSVQSLSSESKNVQTLSTSLNTVKPSTSTDASPQVLKTKIHYQLKETPNKNTLLCKVCNVKVPNATDNITTHINGLSHTNQYEKLLKTNKVSKVQNYFHCHKCDVTITSKNELDHIFGTRHVNMKDSDHGSTISETNSSYSTTNMHVPKAAKIQMPSNNVINQPSTSKMKFQTNTLAIMDDLYQFKMHSNAKQLMCRVCYVEILNKPNDIITHLQGNNHKTCYKNLLKRHSITILIASYYCQTCVEYIPLQQELDHMAGSKHLMKLLLSNQIGSSDEYDSCSDAEDFFCEFCSLLVDDGSVTFEQHQVSAEHVTNIRKISNGTLDLQTDSHTKSKSTLKCSLCDCYVNNNFTCVNQHLQGSSHKSVYNKFLDINKICMVGDKLYCLACKDIIESQQEFVHIRNPNHTGNLSLMS